MRIAAAQISCTLGDVAANVRKMHDWATRAKSEGVELIVFPEMADTGYSMPVIREEATPWSEGAVPELQSIAQSLGLVIISGVSEREGAAIFNTQVVIDADGRIIAKYRKTHLFTPAPIEEEKCFTSGSALAALDVSGLRLGLSICYDLRFPEVYRTLAVQERANVFVLSSAWPFPRVEHLRTLALARAVENQSYFILANRVGTDAGVTFCGSSSIIDPYGVIVASASADCEELVQADVLPGLIDSVRTRMPVFEHRRPQLYAGS